MELNGEVVRDLTASGDDVEAADEGLVSGRKEGVDVVFLESIGAIVELALNGYEWLKIKPCWISV